MDGEGWDGPGQNATTLYWHVEAATPDLGAGQRVAILDALQAWAGVVKITFQEVAVPDLNRSIDFNFVTGDHSDLEPQEAGCPVLSFNFSSAAAHAQGPPGTQTICDRVSGEFRTSAETWAGNVHFNEEKTWFQNDTGLVSPNLTLIACHEIGHALGLLHTFDCPESVMRTPFEFGDKFQGLSAVDIADIRGGYAAGAGAVITLNDTGVWVNRAYAGPERGTQAEPFNTVTEGAAGVPPHSGVVLHVQSGNYADTLTISKAMVLQAENGPVTIGRP